jgi:VWFA-related protein
VRTPAATVLSAVLLAGLPAAAAAQAQFRTETTVVHLDVVVRDARGEPVQDLQQADFEVLENGVVQPIVWFDRSTAGAAAAGEGSRTAPAGPAAEGIGGPPQSVVALVFHQLSQQARSDAVKAAEAMVAQLAPGDFVGVYVFDQSLTELVAFTRDRDQLREAIRTAAMTPPAVRDSSFTPGSAEDPSGSGLAVMPPFRQVSAPFEASAQGDAFAYLVNVLNGFVGRRAVVLLSEGLAAPEVNPRLEDVIEAAAPANVSFYTIDAGGLRASGRRNRSPRRLQASELTSVSRDADRQAHLPEMDVTLGMRPLAELTGGVYQSDSNDVTALLTRANADRQSYYVLAYGVDPAAAQGRRTIEVRIKRPDTYVRARTRLERAATDAGGASPHNLR